MNKFIFNILRPQLSTRIAQHVRPSSSVSTDDTAQLRKIFGVLQERLLNQLRDDMREDELRALMKKQNGFKVFGIDQKFNINTRKLQQEMRNMQRILHPDRFVNANHRVQHMSNYLCAVVNDYYELLCDPYERAKHLLALVENKTMQDIDRELDKVQVGKEFLTRMMEIQEKLDVYTKSSQLELEKLLLQVHYELGDLIKELDRDFANKDHKAIYDKLGQLKFLNNIYKKAGDCKDRFDL